MSKIGYTLSLDSAVIERDRIAFEAALEATEKLGFEYIQQIENNEITAYLSIVITDINYDRLKQVEKLYAISPSEERTRGGESHYIFLLSQPTNTKLAIKTAENLSLLYGASYTFATFFSGNSVITPMSSATISTRQINKLFTHRVLTDSVNETKLKTVNEIPLAEIQSILKDATEYDHILNIIPNVGTPFEYVYEKLGSTTAAYRFFNEHFNSGFLIGDGSTSEYLKDGVAVGSEARGIIEHRGSYYVQTAKGEDKQITDFTIRVHYKIIRHDMISYIVSMMNQAGHEVHHIEWKNTTSEQAVADFVQKFGPFHFLGTKDHVRKLHQMISSAEVPVIQAYTQYGKNDYKGNEIMLFPDGVYDITLKKFFPKDEETGIYFLGGNDGLMYSPNANASATPELKHIPQYGVTAKRTMEDFIGFSKEVFADESAWIIWMTACSMAGYMLYADDGVKTPLYFLTGPTGTGKSTYADILAKAFGVESLYNIGLSTVYPFKILMSALSRLPVFLTEYRSSMANKDQKDEILRLTFDQGSFQRGRQNGEMLSYSLAAQVFLEGEDMYTSGSIRTRTIVHKTKRSGRKEGLNVRKFIGENQELIESFLSSYIARVDKKKYAKAFLEARDFVYRPGVEPRIIDNFCIFYAGCVAFAPEYKDEMVAIMHDLIVAQQKDYEQNGQVAQIVKIVGQYVSMRYANVYFDGNHVIISWDDILSFVNRERKKMELSEDANYGLLLDRGFEGGMFEVTRKDEWNARETFMINGFRIHISQCPEYLFTNKEIYTLFKSYQASLGK